MPNDDLNGGGWTRVDPAPAEPTAAPHEAPEPRLQAYGPLGRRALLARASLLLVTLASVIAVVFDVAERSLLARVGTGDPVTSAELAASNDRQLAISVAQLALWILAAGFFIAWLHRAYKNLDALGVRQLRYGTGWAIGSWFVPILNLFRPKQIVNDVWRGSHPRLADPAAWRDTPVPRVLDAWWAAYLLSAALYGVAERVGFSAEDTDAFELTSALYIAADSITVVAGLLAVVVVDRTTARQAARVAFLAGDAYPGARVRRWLHPRRRLAAAAALCGAAAGVGVLTLALQPTGATGSVEADEVPEPVASEETYSLTDDFSDPRSGWTQEENDEASMGYAGGEYRMTVTQPNYSWFSFLSPGVAVSRMRVEADVTLESSGSEEGAVGTGCFVTELTGYLVGVWPDGYYAIGLDPPDSEEFALLADGVAADAVNDAGQPNQIAIDCEAGPPGIVTLAVNGRTIGEARHNEGLGAFQLASLIVTAGPEPATGRFDNFVLESFDR